MGEIVLRPAGVSFGGEGDPGGVHGVGDLLWRVGSRNRLKPVFVEIVKDEGDLKRMAGTELAIELRGTPGKFVHIGSRRALCVCLGQADGGNAIKPVSDDGDEQVARARVWSEQRGR